MICLLKEWLALSDKERDAKEVMTVDPETDAGEMFWHPALERMSNGEAPSDIIIMSTWTDDHLPCLRAQIDFKDEQYVAEMLWTGTQAIFDLGRCIGNSAASKEFADERSPE